jgi:hypothetical protein
MMKNDVKTSDAIVEPSVTVLTPKPMITTDLSGLAALFQRWAEMCEQGAENELTPALQWFLKGMAFAHGFDAKRTRDLNRSAVTGRPPKGDLGLIQAFESMLALLQAMGTAEVQEDDLP